MKDVQLVPEYFDECFQYMLQREKKIDNYMLTQTDLSEKNRGVLFDWIF